ncbi:hypothetical protein HHI36_000312 [Cryptolaemus montrouzieri]|uniref:Uncharacterized protein n=1 Tax=Cryptolaemus montrouzieri TaxID=559131 RepID=A0ABD2P507_9CUCU
MGRRALQRSPKPGSNPGTPTPSDSSQNGQDPVFLSDDASRVQSQTSQSAEGGRGLDRVLLERNLERLLVDRNTHPSQDLEKLLHSRDRSREPLHLADLSLDDWSPNVRSDNIDSNSQNESKLDTNSTEYLPELETPQEDVQPHASSMPELAASTSNAQEQPTTPGSPNKRDKATLSVRFMGDNDAFECDETDTATVEATSRLPRSRSYSGRSKYVDTLSRKGKSKRPTNLLPQIPSTSRHHDEDDNRSYCSTCSSSSSSDDLDYQLPPRRAYGGVRISYVPNDALACARRRQASSQSPQGKKPSLDDKDKNCVIS